MTDLFYFSGHFICGHFVLFSTLSAQDNERIPHSVAVAIVGGHGFGIFGFRLTDRFATRARECPPDFFFDDFHGLSLFVDAEKILESKEVVKHEFSFSFQDLCFG